MRKNQQVATIRKIARRKTMATVATRLMMMMVLETSRTLPMAVMQRSVVKALLKGTTMMMTMIKRVMGSFNWRTRLSTTIRRECLLGKQQHLG